MSAGERQDAIRQNSFSNCWLENSIGQQTPPPITHPEYFYGFIGVGLAWQLLFLVLSSDPAKYRAMILPSIAEKISFGVALVILRFEHRIAASTMLVGSVDWVFAFLFLAAYFKTQSSRVAS